MEPAIGCQIGEGEALLSKIQETCRRETRLVGFIVRQLALENTDELLRTWVR